MKPKKLEELENNELVEYRVGRAGPTSVVWEPWMVGTLYVNKRETDLASKYRKRAPDTWRAGSILTLTPHNSITAEFGQGDYCGNGIFCAEDYYLEIKNLI